MFWKPPSKVHWVERTFHWDGLLIFETQKNFRHRLLASHFFKDFPYYFPLPFLRSECVLRLKIFLQKNLSSSGNNQKWFNWSCEHFLTFDWSTPGCRTTGFWHFWFFVATQNQDMDFSGPTYHIFWYRWLVSTWTVPSWKFLLK